MIWGWSKNLIVLRIVLMKFTNKINYTKILVTPWSTAALVESFPRSRLFSRTRVR